MLLALALGATALLPFGALGQPNQVTGLVSTCAPPLQFPSGVTVTLIDVNGISPPQTTLTTPGGSYSFTPPTGDYVVAVNKTGYYSNATVTPVRFDGTQTKTIDVCMYAQPTTSKKLTVNVLSSGSPVAGANVAAFNLTNPTGRPQLVTNGSTNAAGFTNLTLWGGQFQLRTSANLYMTDTTNVNVATTSSATISLVAGIELIGHARDPQGRFLSAGLIGWLYNPSAPNTSAYRLIPAAVSGSLYDFHAPAGTYTVIIDANRSAAYEATVALPGITNPYDVVLQPARQEFYNTTVLFNGKDWNNFTVWRNITLNPDSTLVGLSSPIFHDLRLQIDATTGIGNGDGILSPAEIANFQTFLNQKGPAYVTTDGFLLLNGKAYNSTSFQVFLSPTLPTPGARVWINTTSNYILKNPPPWIGYGATKYFLNMTLVPDTNGSSYQNFTYTVSLAQGYEMVTDTIIPSTSPPAITTSGYTRILIDPGVLGTKPQIKMVLNPALNGTARAKVTAPVGKFTVVNSTYQNYQAYVQANTNINFTAADSTNPPSNDPTRANFTWKFESNTTCGAPCTRYGLTPTFSYSTAGEYKLNVTMVGSGGNVSYRTITIWADGITPTAMFKTNITGSGSAVNLNLTENQGIAIRFDGSLSSDLAFTSPFVKKGIIPNSGYAWDFNGDRITDATGVVANYTFNKPGNFTVNLTVTDGVGLKGANASLRIQVNDTEPPKPAFTVLDPNSDWVPVSFSGLKERKNYTLNASRTSDNYDPLAKLNFTWTIPGPLISLTGTNHTFWGVNITFGWSQWNNSYPVKLVVRDTGFGSGKPNNGTLTQNLTVGIVMAYHADLFIVVGSMKIDNTNPEAGTQIKITVNVTNKLGWAKAMAIQVDVTAATGTTTIHLPASQVTWFDKSGANLGSSTSIPGGTTQTLQVLVTPTNQGNTTITIKVWDNTEPYTLVTSENQASMTILVRQPGWINIAIIGSVVGVFAVFIVGVYYRRKVKAGEWQPRFRRGEKGEKPKKEREVKEEKKRL